MSGINGATFGGGPAPFTETHTVVCGSSISSGPPFNVSTGYSSTFSPTMGSMTNPTFGLKGGVAITNLYCLDNTAVYFILDGTQTNAGWTSITFSSTGLVLNRASGSFSNSSGYTYWLWSVGANPLNTGETVLVGFV